MTNQIPQQLQVLPVTETARLQAAYDILDELHTAASQGQVTRFAGMEEAEMLNWLRDVIYTAQETIAEIQRQAPSQENDETVSNPLKPAPHLRLLEKRPRGHAPSAQARQATPRLIVMEKAE